MKAKKPKPPAKSKKETKIFSITEENELSIEALKSFFDALLKVAEAKKGKFTVKMRNSLATKNMRTIKLPLFKIGDSVKIKKGVIHPFFDEINMEGWQGRIVEIEDDNLDCEGCEIKDVCSDRSKNGMLFHIEFDSITIKQMPEDFMKQCMREGLDFARTSLLPSQLVIAKARDTIEEANAARITINAVYDDIPRKPNESEIAMKLSEMGIKKEADGISIGDIPLFIKSLSKKTKEGLIYFLGDEPCENKIKSVKSKKPIKKK